MNLKLILLLGLGLFAVQAHGESGIPINNPPDATSQAAGSQSDAERDKIIRNVRISPKQRAELVKAESSASNTKASNTFLAANKTKPGVVTLPSGVQYKILKSGKGKKPTEGGKIVCRYQGKLIDGSTFDKSNGKAPLTLNVAGLVTGLKEAVKLMTTGSKWEIVIPPNLAYGDKGYRRVGPNAVVIYDMEIVSIK